MMVCPHCGYPLTTRQNGDVWCSIYGHHRAVRVRHQRDELTWTWCHPAVTTIMAHEDEMRGAA